MLSASRAGCGLSAREWLMSMNIKSIDMFG
jgi:hypothetical protein